MKSIIFSAGLGLSMMSLSGCGTIRDWVHPESENGINGAGQIMVSGHKQTPEKYELLDLEQLLKDYHLDRYSLDQTALYYPEKNDVDTAKLKAENSALILRRNSLQDRIISSSNQRCNDYLRLIANSKAEAQLGWGSLALLLGTAAPITSPLSLGKALTAGATVSTGILTTFNDAYFNNLALTVVTTGIKTQRRALLQAISINQAQPLEKYTVNAAIADAISYHASCSIVIGLETAANATAAKSASDTATTLTSDSQVVKDAVTAALKAYKQNASDSVAIDAANESLTKAKRDKLLVNPTVLLNDAIVRP